MEKSQIRTSQKAGLLATLGLAVAGLGCRTSSSLMYERFGDAYVGRMATQEYGTITTSPQSEKRKHDEKRNIVVLRKVNRINPLTGEIYTFGYTHKGPELVLKETLNDSYSTMTLTPQIRVVTPDSLNKNITDIDNLADIKIKELRTSLDIPEPKAKPVKEPPKKEDKEKSEKKKKRFFIF